MSDVPPLNPDVRPNPEMDGVDHINVYSKAKTQLGHDLSNFAHVPFSHPKFGFFASMEAYWYWLGTGMQHDALRRLYGATAKTAGIRLMTVAMDQDTFRKHIEDGLRLKVVQNAKLCQALKKTTLPLRHYFVYGTNPPVVNEPRKHHWQMECLEAIRETIKEGRSVLLSDGTPAETLTIREVPENPTPSEFAFRD